VELESGKMRDALLGAWSARSAEEEIYPDGSITYPFGAVRKARIIYSMDGYVTAISTPAERRPIGAMLSPWSYDGATAEEVADLVSLCVAYSGRFEVFGSAVHHRVDTAINPLLIGQILVREVTLEGDRLTMTGPVGEKGTFLRIHWGR